LGIPKRDVLEDEAVYHAPVDALVAVVRRFHDEWDVVGLVGHNPGFSDLAEYLSDFGSGTMATCSVMAIGFDVDSWGNVDQGSGKVAFYDYPKNPDPGTS
jgi:phosphohistidine phosphatase